MSILSISSLSVSFGGLNVLSDVNFDVKQGEIVGIIGPNGAGKTTLMNAVCGNLPPSGGRIMLDGHVLNGLSPDQIAALGLRRTFQASQLFPGMTVLENMMTGFHLGGRTGIFGAAFRSPGMRKEEARTLEQARQALRYVRMEQYAERRGDELSFGQQRIIEIARALANEPSVILLDEPAVGLSVTRVEELITLLRRIREEKGVTLVMVEHVIRAVMGVSDRIVVLNSGTKIADGTPDQVRRDPAVITAYLGSAAHAEVRNLNVWYGKTEVLHDVTFSVDASKVVALLGGNGSGKTTILNTLSGVVKPRTGSMAVNGRVLVGLEPYDIVKAGVVQVPQGREVFASMTVLDNLELGAATRSDKGEIRRDLDEVFGMFPRLHERRMRNAGYLSGGEQQQLALGRSLLARPKVLLMDEPSAGLAPSIVDSMITTIKLLHQRGLTILLVEQNVGVAAAVAETAHVLQNGEIVYTGDAAGLINNEKVLASYLGT